MVFSEEDKHVIKFFRQKKHYEAKGFLKEFPHKSRYRRLDKIIRKLDCTGTLKRLPGSGRPHTAQTVEKIEEAKTLALSQENLLQAHCTQRQNAQDVGITQRSVNRIVKEDLR